MRRIFLTIAALVAAFLLPGHADAQAVLQAGPILNGGGHAPMYLNSGPQGLATVMDSGAAGGGPIGYGLSEKLLQARGSGTGPMGAHDCDWDTYATNSAGAHYLCLDANLGGSGNAAIVAGGIGGASASGCEIILNGQVSPCIGQVSGTPFAATKAALAALPSTYSAAVIRVDYASGFGAPPVLYVSSSSPCSLNSGAGDGGLQVPTSDGKCWLARFDGPADLRVWGAPTDGTTDAGPFINTACADYGALLVPQTTNGFLIKTSIVCTNVSISGTLASPTNPYPATGFPGQAWFNCNTGAGTVCLTIGSASGSATAPINISNLIVSQATTPAPSGFTALEVLNSYRTKVSNVHVYNADTCLLAKGNGTVGVDLTFDDVGVDRCQTHWWVFDQINGVHVIGGDDGTDASTSGDPEYTGSTDVYEFTNTAGGANYQGPNTISLIDHRYFNSTGGAACLLNWANFNPATPNWQTAGGEIKLIGDHFEQHGFIGSDRAAFCSDSTVALINVVGINNDTFTMGSPSFGFFALNSATALKDVFISSNNLGGCGNVTLAPTPASGAALMDVNFANNVGCSAASFTSNGIGNNYLHSSGNDWAAFTVGGAWARLSSISDVYNSLTDTASGNVDWINAFPLSWTPVLEFGGTPASSLGWTVTPTSTIVRRDGSGFNAMAIMTISAKGTASGAQASIVGLPWNCLNSYGEPAPLVGAGGFTSGAVTAPIAQMGAPVSGQTPIYLYKSGATGSANITDNDMTATTVFTVDVNCSRTE